MDQYAHLADSINARVKAKVKATEIIMDDDDKILWKKAIQAEKYDFMRQYIKTVYHSEFQSTGKLPFDLPEAKEIMEKAYKITASKPPYMFVTVNARPDVTLETFKKVIDKFINKKTNITYFGVYEHRGAEEISSANIYHNKGLHAHILVHYTQTPYGFSRGAKNTFKHVCDVNNPHTLNFRNVTEDKLESKIKYMLGEKQTSKLDKVAADVIWRAENNLPDYFESRSPFPCRPAQIIN